MLVSTIQENLPEARQECLCHKSIQIGSRRRGLFTPASQVGLAGNLAAALHILFTKNASPPVQQNAPHFMNKKEAAFFCGLLVHQEITKLTNRFTGRLAKTLRPMNRRTWPWALRRRRR
jgi:hypothetical protein